MFTSLNSTEFGSEELDGQNPMIRSDNWTITSFFQWSLENDAMIIASIIVSTWLKDYKIKAKVMTPETCCGGGCATYGLHRGGDSDSQIVLENKLMRATYH